MGKPAHRPNVLVTNYPHILYAPFRGVDLRVYQVERAGTYHTHAAPQIITVIDGEILFLDADEKRYQCRTGEVLVIPAGVEHSWQALPTPCTTLQLYHDPLSCAQYGELAFLFGGSQQTMSKYRIDDREFQALSAGIVREIQSRHYQGGLLLHARLIELLALIVRSAQVIDPAQKHSHQRISQALAYLEEHFAEKITLSDLARTVCLSPSRLSHLFRDALGMAPVEYLLTLRLARAKNLMLYSDLTFSQIAVQCGFGSLHYFSRVFKKHFGESPSAFLQKQQDRANLSNPS